METYSQLYATNIYNDHKHLNSFTYRTAPHTDTRPNRKKGPNWSLFDPRIQGDSRAGGQSSVGVPDRVRAAWPTTARVGPVVRGSLDGE